MTDREELGEYFRRLNNSISCLMEVQRRTLDLRLLYPDCQPNLAVIDSLTKDAMRDIAWVNTRISMECCHLDDKD